MWLRLFFIVRCVWRYDSNKYAWYSRAIGLNICCWKIFIDYNLFQMKKGIFLYFLLLLFMPWCSFSSEDMQDPEDISWVVVRNIKRWMTTEEVKRAETVKGSDIVNRFEVWNIVDFIVHSKLWDKPVLLGYVFIDNQLSKVYYVKKNAKFDDYFQYRRILGQKYWTWDITKQEFEEIVAENKELESKVDDIAESDMPDNQKIAKLEEFEKEMQANASRMQEYLFSGDIIWTTDMPPKLFTPDQRLSLGDMYYFHNWKTNQGLVQIALWEGVHNWSLQVNMLIEYADTWYQEKIGKSIQEQEQKEVYNSL